METDQFELLAAQYLTHRISPAELVHGAAELLQRVPDTADAVTELATMDGNTAHRNEVVPVLTTALDQLGCPEPTSKRLADLLVYETAKRIHNGRTPPVTGASEIWQLWDDFSEKEPIANSLLVLTDDWEENPSDRDAIENEIRDKAYQILNAQRDTN